MSLNNKTYEIAVSLSVQLGRLPVDLTSTNLTIGDEDYGGGDDTGDTTRDATASAAAAAPTVRVAGLVCSASVPQWLRAGMAIGRRAQQWFKTG